MALLYGDLLPPFDRLYFDSAIADDRARFFHGQVELDSSFSQLCLGHYNHHAPCRDSEVSGFDKHGAWTLVGGWSLRYYGGHHVPCSERIHRFLDGHYVGAVVAVGYI